MQVLRKQDYVDLQVETAVTLFNTDDLNPKRTRDITVPEMTAQIMSEFEDYKSKEEFLSYPAWSWI